MITKFHRIRQERLNGERGFTLTELLVVIVIIGILVAIAIPVFLSQREAAFAKAAESDVRNAIPTIETYYANNNAYPSAATIFVGDGGSGSATASPAFTVNVSPEVTLTYTPVAAAGTTGPGYTLLTTHKQLNKQTWTYTSATSKIVHATLP